MARPQLEIDEDTVEKLASIHCTMNEIASVVGCSVDTLERRFAEVIARGRDKGKTSLRRIQFEIAKKGNAQMAIWLGRILLGQKEIVDGAPLDPSRQTPTITIEQLKELLKTARGLKAV